MRHGIDKRHVATGPHGQMMVCPDVRGIDQLDFARIHHDQFRTLAQPVFQARSEDRMGIAGICAHHQDHVCMGNGIEGLRAGRLTQGRFQPIACWRMADPGTGIHIIVAKSGPDHLLHQEGFFIGAARGRDAADAVIAIFALDASQSIGRVADRLIPADFPPGVVNIFADHWTGNPVLVRGVSKGEAALDAGVALVGLALLVGRHAQDFIALQFGHQGAAHAAIGTGCDHAALRQTVLNDRILNQRLGGAVVHAGAAGHAIRIHKTV